MKRLLAIFAALVLLLAALLAWQGWREPAAWLGAGAGLVLFLLAAHRVRCYGAELPRETRERMHWLH